MKEVVVATRNKGKVREFGQMLSGLGLAVLSLEAWPELPEPEETGATFLDNAELKAAYYAKATGKLCLADDSGLEVAALGGAPGVLSARYAGEHGGDRENNALLLKNMAGSTDRRCRFFCALALVAPDGQVVLESEGACEGELLFAERGEGGFGYDPLFYSRELGKSLAEATPEEKNAVSHRGKALAALVKKWGEQP